MSDYQTMKKIKVSTRIVESESPSINRLVLQMEEFFMNQEITYSVCEKCNGLNRVAFSFPNGKTPICGKCKSSLTLFDGVNDLTASSLETLTNKSPLPVVVDFWAPWCGPCRSFAPTFVEAASQQKNKIVFGKINTETNPSAGQKFAIKGIPTLVIFYRGEEVSRISGALPVEEFVGWVSRSTQALV